MAKGRHGLGQAVKDELSVYRLVLADPRTPRAARVLLGIAVAYLLSPIDLIPDFIPVLGQIDDLIVIPALVAAAVRMVPPVVMEESRAEVSSRRDRSTGPG